MPFIIILSLTFSLCVYSKEIHLTAESSGIYQVSHDTTLTITPQPTDQLIMVENQDLDTFGSLTIAGQTTNSATWMGAYGNYLIYIPSNSANVTIKVQPLESKVEHTSVKLTWVSLQHKSVHFIQAVQAFIKANDLRIKQYLGHSNQTTAAIELFTAAIQGFEQEQNQFFTALSLFEKGKALIEVGEHVEGLKHLKKSVEMWSIDHKKQYLRATNFLGLAYWNTGQLKKALLAFEKVINLYTNELNPLVLAQAISNAGLINLELGEFSQAKQQFYQSLEINDIVIDFDHATSQEMVAAINHNDDVKNTAATLNNMALVYDALGEPEKAEIIWLAYIEVSKNLSNRTTLAKAKNNLAMHYLRKGDYEQAQALLESAKNSFEENRHSRWLSLTHHNLGVLYAELGLMDLAEIQYLKALNLRDQINHPNGHMESLFQLASTYRKQAKLKLSLKLSKKLQHLAENKNNNRYQALSHLNQYHYYSQQADLSQATYHINQAVQYIKNSPYKRLSSQINITKAEHLTQTQKYAEATEILTSEVKTLKKIWNTKLLNRANNLLARTYYLNREYEAASVVTTEEIKNINFYLSNTFNSKISTNLHVLLKETTNINALILDKLGKQQQGFIQTVQQNNQFKTQQKNNNSTYPVANKNTSEWLAAINHKSMALENIKLSEIEREQLENEIIELKARIDFSYKGTKTEQLNLITLNEIQLNLDAETLLIVYSIGQTDGLSWWVSRDDFICQKVAGKRVLKQMVAASRNELIGLSKSYQHTQELSKLLAHSLSEFQHISKIKLITDEPLNLIAFGGLNDVRSNVSKPIAATTGVQRLLSIDALQNTNQSLSPNSAGLIVADPVNSSHDDRFTVKPVHSTKLTNYPRLKNTQIETEFIATKLNTHSMTGFKANKEDFITTDFKPYKFLHLASHAFFHPEIPGLSSLVLSDFSENGELQKSAYVRALDISQLNTDLDLTVLSGCETGMGDSDDALGLTGLTQSFLAAGSAKVVSSLWQVDDLASTQFMTYFYTHLVKQNTIEEAFWLAQKSMLSQPRTRHPKHWAGWFLITQ